MEDIDYKKLRKDLLNKVGTSGIMPLIIAVESANEKQLLRLAMEYKLDMSDYIKE